jgi:thiol-disulfide isomerase/thioredoxin
MTSDPKSQPKPHTPDAQNSKTQSMSFARRAFPMFILAGLLLSAGLYAGLTGQRKDATPASACALNAEALKTLQPYAKGQMAAFTFSTSPTSFIPMTFKAPGDVDVPLSSLNGKPRLINIWATWCPPCRKEMPSLDRLSRDFKDRGFDVLAISIDTKTDGRVEAFFKETNLTSLVPYTNPSAKIFNDLRSAGLARGVPVTYLIDSSGCIVGKMNGEADWHSQETKVLLEAILGQEATKKSATKP